jgi:indole-3-glycerol phosphate synthase
VSTVLDDILERKRADVAARSRARPLAEIRTLAESAPAPRGFQAALERRISTGAAAVIAEIKRASPSRGVIRESFDPDAIARAYAANGAACLSVLTDEPFFQGRDADLETARRAAALPALRKDFIVDRWQIFESRSIGADAVLLIVAALGARDLAAFHEDALSLGLDVLVEVHDAAELDRALALGARLIGINNRDLRTFETRLETTHALLPRVPSDVRIVTESGIATPADVASMRTRGVHAFLVGEAFMRAADPGRALAELFATPEQ